MNEELKQLLETAYQYELAAQTEDDAEAEVARKAGAIEAYFDLSLHLTLPDTCWALEKWDEAKHWYRHNAKVIVEKRQWHAQHSGPGYPIEAMSDLEAMTIVKAGDLDQGREYITRAIEHWLKEPGNQLVLTKLGLHAAQAGMDDLAQHALATIEARQALPGATSKEAEHARKLLHYEPAQVNLMLGRWNEFQRDVQALELVEQQVTGAGSLVFPEPLQLGLLSASRGLRALLSIPAGEPEVQRKNARLAFEEAMLNFHKFSGRVEWNLYFMRLNTRFADELAVGQQIKVNPFNDANA
ncbi:MAG TPA: hypothetical protein VKB05_21310 [Pyrinomonadaceae bacterium]|nr:hypothetical protein [Pyrinomonadaceae bacterium]